MAIQIAYRKEGNAWQALILDHGKIVKSYVKIYDVFSDTDICYIDGEQVNDLTEEDKKVFLDLDKYIKSEQ